MALTHNNNIADLEPSWGSVDKTSLPRNAHADEGQSGEKSTWKYPHHFVEGGTEKDDMGCWMDGTMYLHKGGLDAAWAAANGARSGEEASQAVKDHLQAHRRALGMDDEEGDSAKVIPIKGYSIKAKETATKEAEIYLYDEIGSSWFGGVSAKQIKNELQQLGEMDKITVHIHSPGGDVFDSMTIYNLLKQNSAVIEVFVDGAAFSGASLIAMAGDKIFMAENSMMMIHEPWTIAMGFAADMRDTADRLEKTCGLMIKTYCKRCGKTANEVSALLTAETWLTPEEAVEMGFADSIVEPMQMAAHFDLDKFKFKKNPLGVAVAAAPDQPAEPTPEPAGQPMQPDLSILDYGISRCTEILSQGAKP